MDFTGISAICAVISVGLYLVTLSNNSAQTFKQTNRYDADLLTARRRETVEFSRLVLSPAFRTGVSALAWHVFLKWLYWEEPATDSLAYRTAVCRGFVGWEQRYQNYDPTRPQPHQLEGPSAGHYASVEPSKGLSEHDALSIWLETWSQLATMLEAELADTDSAVKLLSTLYGYSLPFVIRFIDVVKEAAKAMNVSAPTWVDRLEFLEHIFANDAAFGLILHAERGRLSDPAHLDERRRIVEALAAAA